MIKLFITTKCFKVVNANILIYPLETFSWAVGWVVKMTTCSKRIQLVEIVLETINKKFLRKMKMAAYILTHLP